MKGGRRLRRPGSFPARRVTTCASPGHGGRVVRAPYYRFWKSTSKLPRFHHTVCSMEVVAILMHAAKLSLTAQSLRWHLGAALLLGALSVLSASAHAVSISFMGGNAWSLPTPLTIWQEGQPIIRIDGARWETRPFYESPYYAVRLAWGRWGVELVHHKLYLVSQHSEIQQFWISHGYNLVLVERLTHREPWYSTFGAGLVVGHPETVIRYKELSTWHLSGVAAQASLGYRVPVSSRFALVSEIKLTGAWARVPVADGNAEVPNIAMHAVLGIQYSPSGSGDPARARSSNPMPAHPPR